MKEYSVIVRQKNKKTHNIYATHGQNLLRLLEDTGFLLPSPCGGKGICGKCKVRIVTGEQTKTSPGCTEQSFFDEEEIKAGYRLACQVTVSEDLTIDLPVANHESAQIMVSGEKEVALNPLITETSVSVSKPSINHHLSDVERVEKALNIPRCIPPDLFPKLSSLLRAEEFTISTVLAGDKVLSVDKQSKEKTESGIYGMAVDIGTTTMVGYFINLATGEQIDTYATLNPQKIYGADVISRVDYSIEHENGLAKMTELLRDEINKMIRFFCRANPGMSQRIFDLTLVGNTIMMHIFAGLEIKNIAVSPFIPVVTRNFELIASQIGIEMNPRGRIRILPTIAGFVGADTVGAILACGMGEKEELSLLLDIGTNGEIAIGNKKRILTCSTAAGPAFEGANIRHGIGAVEGAINQVWIDKDLNYSTIGDKPPQGICGSAVVDLVSVMLQTGLVEPSGRMRTRDEIDKDQKTPVKLKMRLREVQGKPALLIAAKSQGATENIYFTQKDIRELQLAKAAITAGIQILLKEMGVTANEINLLYLAGGFGNYINHHSAVNIGLLPKELRKKVVSIGNGAGVGGKMVLLSREYSNLAERIQEKTEYLELSTRMDFQNLFVESLEFPYNNTK